MTDADAHIEAAVWKEVARRIAGMFRPIAMPQYVINMIEEHVREEMNELHKRDKQHEDMTLQDFVEGRLNKALGTTK